MEINIKAEDAEFPLETALERLRERPEWQILVGEITHLREAKFGQLADEADARAIQRLAGEIGILHDLGSLFRG